VRTVVLHSFYIMQRSRICSLSQQQWANFLTAIFADVRKGRERESTAWCGQKQTRGRERSNLPDLCGRLYGRPLTKIFGTSYY